MGCNCQKTPTEQDVKKIAELDQYIDSLLAGTSDERRSGFLIQILHRAQSLFGFLSEETQKHVSEKLRIPVAEIYGVISFYSYFTDKPVGRYKINVCTGTACFVKGAAKVLELTDRLVTTHKLTTLMITHNMRDALRYGNRLVMMHAGRIVVDVKGEEKKHLTVPDLLALFEKGAGEVSDAMMLS